MYYKIPSDPLTALKLLKNDESLCEFVKTSYENKLKIDLLTKHNVYDIMEMIDEELHPKKPVSHVDSDSDVEDPDDEQVESKFKSKKMAINCETQKVDDDKCETSKQGSKKGDGRKAVNGTLSKAIKERRDKKKEYEKKGSLNKGTVPLGCGPHG
ncbi:hypothetical protein Tco_0093714 [Tanacetum coccineum]